MNRIGHTGSRNRLITAMWMFAAVLLVPAWGADLAAVRNEPNLERRSDLALEQANLLIDEIRAAYKEAKLDDYKARLRDLVAAVELSHESLRATGKSARKSPKYFKRAELKTRALLKRIDTLEKDVSFDDREPVVEAKKRIEAINDDLVVQIMTRKPRS
jgi:hypothetical protein